MRKIFIIGLTILFVALLVGKDYKDSVAQIHPAYRGELRGHQVVATVKNKSSAIILPYSAVVYDNVPLNIFNHAIRTYAGSNRLTMDSIRTADGAEQGDTLSTRGAAFIITVRPFGPFTTADTLILFGKVLNDPFFSVLDGYTNASAGGDTIPIILSQVLTADSMFQVSHYYSDIDSARIMLNSSSTADSFLLQAWGINYVLQADSGAGIASFAGIAKSAIGIDTTNKVTNSGVGNGTGLVVVSGITKARITANPDSITYPGNPIGVATSAGLLKTIGHRSVLWSAGTIDSLAVAEALEPNFPSGSSFLDTVFVRIRSR